MGLDIDFMIKNISVFLDAMKITLEIAFLGIVLSLIIGIITSNLIYFKVPVLSKISKIYIELSRNTPLLIQLFFLYYGLTKFGISFSGFECGVIGLSFLGGSYMSESIRAGLEAVPKGQIESGISIGLSKFQIFRLIILPQAFYIAIPAIGANSLFLIKETSIVGSIAVAELMFVTKDIIGMQYKTSEALVMLIIAYLIILLPISIFIRYLEKRGRYAEYGV
ncbi:amino acid ABC transporter permease [Clostridium sp. LY3-2]|uniref:amino acid ABC transporter permease n=1 Tax=Clostridium sp. LY3-2 TaxID=2942482 RepID=UPI002152BC65|nr:amino acid ABC transporter permease [Clostridium sp. LY3-2]MCR6513872.1 amino acid ABC transporter permease [Clostridium sp. LY3-2]